MHNIIKILVGIICVLLTHKTSTFAEDKGQKDVDSAEIVFQQFLDSVGITAKEIDEKVSSTRVFGGSSPVSFSGEARVKAAYHNLKTDMEWTVGDRSYIQSGWDGNESMMRIGMVVRPDRNTVLWSKIGFQSTFPGLRWFRENNPEGEVAQYLHDKSMITANIHEDMCAGIAVRTVPASFMLKMGNINWVEASPFTIWKAQPRTFAWEYLPYEIEQPIGRYYEYNIAKGEKAGRAAWHKKPFNGINFESISLPANLYLNVLWATYERYDNFEQEYVDFSNDLAYADDFPLKGTGIGDNYRHIFHLRLAKNKMIGELTPAFNLCMYHYNDDVIMAQDNNGYLFLKALGVYDGVESPLPILKGKAFYKEPKIFSFDLRGKVGDLLELHSDVAIGKVDTTFLIWDSLPTNEFTKSYSSTQFIPAFYSKIAFNKFLPLQLDIAAIGKGFYAPSSFVATTDAFYAYGSNLVGSGKFISRGEASPYVQNMAGALISYIPKIPGYGHLRVAYGQHFQIQPGRDILYFPYRLNGIDFFSFWHSSYARWGQMTLPGPKGKTEQKGRRLGNESFLSSAYDEPLGMEGGGVYTDYLATYECFVPWGDNVEAARKNIASQARDVSYTRVVDGDTSITAFIPVNRKFTNNFEIDVAYDISGLIGFPNDFFLGGYAAINNVTTAFSPLAISEKGNSTQLWSIYLRFEPAIALTKQFYLLGILGFENWRSDKALMNIRYDSFKNEYLGEDVQPILAVGSGTRRIALYKVPIDYRDMAIGLGFDWEILNRVGIHGRFKYMTHQDVYMSYNNWSTPVVSMEIKTWF
ncbi:MAG: hypothetical protein N2511_06710 [Thermodesulfovibrionales bacterium]|nr:hypothetical protein [Thermodesulfovibrionales bacterium]